MFTLGWCIASFFIGYNLSTAIKREREKRFRNETLASIEKNLREVNHGTN